MVLRVDALEGPLVASNNITTQRAVEGRGEAGGVTPQAGHSSAFKAFLFSLSGGAAPAYLTEE